MTLYKDERFCSKNTLVSTKMRWIKRDHFVTIYRYSCNLYNTICQCASTHAQSVKT